MCIAQSNKGPAPIKSGFWLFFSTFYILSFRTVDFFTLFICVIDRGLFTETHLRVLGWEKKRGGGGGRESN